MQKIKDLLPLNFALMGNPVNWAIVVLMVALAGISLAYIFSASRNNGATSNGN